MKIGLPAAKFATAGHPKIIEQRNNYESLEQAKQAVFNFRDFLEDS